MMSKELMPQGQGNYARSSTEGFQKPQRIQIEVRSDTAFHEIGYFILHEARKLAGTQPRAAIAQELLPKRLHVIWVAP